MWLRPGAFPCGTHRRQRIGPGLVLAAFDGERTYEKGPAEVTEIVHRRQREGRAWGGATEPPAGAVGSGGGRVCSWAALGRHSVGAAEG